MDDVLKQEVLEKIIASVIDNFYSKKRTCGIVIEGGTENQRQKVVFDLIPKVDVFVYTPKQCPPEGSYRFNISKYLS